MKLLPFKKSKYFLLIKKRIDILIYNFVKKKGKIALVLFKIIKWIGRDLTIRSFLKVFPREFLTKTLKIIVLSILYERLTIIILKFVK